MSTTTEDVMRLMGDLFGISIESLTPESSSEAVETWDSLNHLKLCMKLEEIYGVQIDMELIPELSTVQKIADFLDLADKLKKT